MNGIYVFIYSFKQFRGVMRKCYQCKNKTTFLAEAYLSKELLEIFIQERLKL